MARTDIARVVARAVLEGLLDGDGNPVVASIGVVDRVLGGAVVVKRRRMRDVGEVVDLTFVVPPDPTTPED